MKSSLRVTVIAGLAVGGALGMAGTFVAGDHLRAVLWAIDGVALIVATALLALHFFRTGADTVAAGFLVYAIGEAVMLGGTAGDPAAGVPAFAAGTALWSAALLMTSLPNVFALWTRAAAIIGAVLFAVTSLAIFVGRPLTPLTKPLPQFAYPFLVLTFVGWAIAIARDHTPVAPQN